MKYLLDVNVLVALAYTGHTHHQLALQWYRSKAKSATGLHSCSITEIGFLRVSLQTGLQRSISDAQKTLADLKKSSRIPFSLIGDDIGAESLPDYVSTAPAITDGHLLELARKHQMKLATFDKGIPGAECLA